MTEFAEDAAFIAKLKRQLSDERSARQLADEQREKEIAEAAAAAKATPTQAPGKYQARSARATC
jgi:flagellar motility protein MotE (MotC chaperone)